MTALDLARFLEACCLDKVLRPWPILGDMMAPRLKRGDLIFCRPVERYSEPGVYVLLDGTIYYAERFAGVVTLRPDNPHYRTEDVSAEWFDANALARAEYALNSMDGEPLPGVLDVACFRGGRARG